MTEKVKIYHTNDIHSHLETWPRLSHALNQARENLGPNETVFTFDLGDFVDRHHPLTEATDGQANVDLLNQAHYDAVTIGNNEGVSNDYEQLNKLYTNANFDVILSNLRDNQTRTYPRWTEPFKIYQTNGGARIGVMACTIPLNVSYEPMGWTADEPRVAIQKMLSLYRSKVDIFILLSHLGINRDHDLAEEFPIDIIIGSHTHHALQRGEKVNGTLITAAGRYGEYLGKIDLEIGDHQIRSRQAELLSTKTDLEPLADEHGQAAAYCEEGRKLLQQRKVGHLPKSFSVSWQGQSDFVDLGLDAIADHAQTDLAILNAGLFLIPLLSGVVTDLDLHQALPHPMRILKSTMVGRDLAELITSMEYQRSKLRDLELSGIGFRGKVFGELCYKGIEVRDNRILIHNQEIDMNKVYTFAAVDHYLFAPFFPTIKKAGDNEILFPDFLRKVVGKYLKRHFPLDE